MEGLDYLYRRMIGDETSDLLLERGVHLDLLFADKQEGTIAFGRMGGYESWHDSAASRCLVGHGGNKAEAAASLVTGCAKIYHAPNMKSSLWAFGEACELLAAAMGQNRQHEYFVCDGKQPKCIEARCLYCEGGLAYCVKCKQGEAELEDYCRGS